MQSLEQAIARHLNMLEQRQSGATIDLLLREAGLARYQGSITRADGTPVDNAASNAYLRAVEKILGETAARFTRANFALAGCTLETDEADSPPTSR